MPDAPAAIAFWFEGEVVLASPGQSLAAALTAAGVDPGARGESLDVAAFARIAAAP